MDSLTAVSRILSHLPVDDHQPTQHDAAFIVQTLSGMSPEELRAFAELAKERLILKGMIETELRSRGPSDP